MKTLHLTAASALAFLAAAASAAAGTIPVSLVQNVDFPANAKSMTRGPDGNIWLVDNTHSIVGRITLAGEFTGFSTPTPGAGPYQIVSAPDGNLWFPELSGRKIGRITPAGAITEFPLPASFAGLPWQIASGPDGNLWFLELADGKRIGRLTPDGTFAEFRPTGAVFMAGLALSGGFLWAIDTNAGLVFRLQPDGTSQSFPTPGPVPGSGAAGVEGPDGNLWFIRGTNGIGRMTPAGAFTEFSVPTPGANPAGLAAGGDGNIWFSEYNSGALGQLVVASIAGSSATINESPYIVSGPADFQFLPHAIFGASAVVTRGARSAAADDQCALKILVRSDSTTSNGNAQLVTIPGTGTSTCADLVVKPLEVYHPRGLPYLLQPSANVENHGPDAASGLTITGTMYPPGAIANQTLTCSFGTASCVGSSSQLVCSVPVFHAGDTCNFSPLFGILPGTHDVAILSVSVSSGTPDQDPSNNGSRARSELGNISTPLPADPPVVGIPVHRGPH